MNFSKVHPVFVRNLHQKVTVSFLNTEQCVCLTVCLSYSVSVLQCDKYIVLGTVERALHFTPWQTCSFTLHSLADLFLYTSPPGRLVPLHFTPWQICSFTLHPLADLFLYPLADLFIQTPTRQLWEAFSNVAITLQKLFIHLCPPLPIAR